MMSVKVVRIESRIASLRASIAYLESLADAGHDYPNSEATRLAAIGRLKGNLKRAEESLEVTRLLEKPRVDPLQTDIEAKAKPKR